MPAATDDTRITRSRESGHRALGAASRWRPGRGSMADWRGHLPYPPAGLVQQDLWVDPCSAANKIKLSPNSAVRVSAADHSIGVIGGFSLVRADRHGFSIPPRRWRLQRHLTAASSFVQLRGGVVLARRSCVAASGTGRGFGATRAATYRARRAASCRQMVRNLSESRPAASQAAGLTPPSASSGSAIQDAAVAR